MLTWYLLIFANSVMRFVAVAVVRRRVEGAL